MTENTGLHVAIIPDGNRRWARAHGLEATKGHQEAVRQNRLQKFLQQAKQLDVRVVSVWVFSTDNWKRAEAEKKALFSLLDEQLKDVAEIAEDEDVQVRWVGRRDRVNGELRRKIESLEEATKDNTTLLLQLCLDYGGRDELVRAINKAVADGVAVSEESFEKYLDTPLAPDLIIRTSGEQRLSGFFPWQGAYAEVYFTDKYFPEFSPEDLVIAVTEFRNRQRRFGGD